MRIRLLIVLLLASLTTGSVLAEDVLQASMYYWHPIGGESTISYIKCGEIVHIDDAENMEITITCDPDGPGNCYDHLLYRLESGDQTYQEYSSTGNYRLTWVEVDSEEDVLRAKIGDGDWCEFNAYVWDIPSEMCGYFIQRIYFDCTYFVRDDAGTPLNLTGGQESCGVYGEGWVCMEECLASDWSCEYIQYCSDMCFPADPGDDDDDDNDTEGDDDTGGDDDDNNDNDDTSDDDDDNGTRTSNDEDDDEGVCNF